MEDGKILYFYLDADVLFKKHWWNQGMMRLSEADMGECGRLECCGVPEYYRKGTAWESTRLADVLGGILEERRAERYYLQPAVARMLEMEEKFPPETLLQKVFGQIPCLEYLIYVGWGREDQKGNERKQAGDFQTAADKPEENFLPAGAFAEEAFREECRLLRWLLGPYLVRINHFTLITDLPAAYEDFTEYLYEEYGIPAATVRAMGDRAGRNGKTVVLDNRKGYRIPCHLLPRRASYVDFWSVDEKRKQMEGMRSDIKYISPVKFLDTLVKNGYNTIVN